MVLIPCLPAIRTAPPDIELARAEGKMGIVKYVFKWILFLIAFPFVVLFTWTIPNCSDNRKWYVVTLSFCMSILWIAIISFAMVTIVARVGCILNIDQFTMGLVVVAVGTSVPVSVQTILYIATYLNVACIQGRRQNIVISDCHVSTQYNNTTYNYSRLRKSSYVWLLCVFVVQCRTV